MLKLIRDNMNKGGRLYTFINPYSYLLARKNKELFMDFNIMIDGILLVKLLGFVRKGIVRKSFDMTSMANTVFQEAVEHRKKIYFIGSSPAQISQAVANIKQNYPRLIICGYRDGYIEEKDKTEVIQGILNINPDIVVCGMGTLLQEKFLLDLTREGWKGVGYTCGGFLSQSSKDINFYPNWIDKYHLRWLYRFYKEPHVRKRVFISYPLFLFVFLFDFYKFKIYKD